MKKVLLAFVMTGIMGVLAHAQAQTPPPQTTPPTTVAPQTDPPVDPNAGEFKFNEETYDFGDIPQGTPVNHDFVFTNVGKEPLIIKNVQASCGCTTPTKPTEPVLPGKQDKINVQYNAAHVGQFTKTVTITSNGKTPSKVIYIKGNVLQKPSDQTTPEKQPNMMQQQTPVKPN